MSKVAPIDQRKADHIKINLERDVRSALTTGLENYRFIHEALPELDLEQIDTSLSLFNKQLAAPILISSMTGGTAEAESINLRLAEAAQEMKIAMGVGSQRAAIEDELDAIDARRRAFLGDLPVPHPEVELARLWLMAARSSLFFRSHHAGGPVHQKCAGC